MRIDMYIDKYVDACIGMRIYMCMRVRICMPTDMHADMRVDTRADNCHPRQGRKLRLCVNKSICTWVRPTHATVEKLSQTRPF